MIFNFNLQQASSELQEPLRQNLQDLEPDEKKRIFAFDIFKIYFFHWLGTFPDSTTAPRRSAAPLRVSGLVATWKKLYDLNVYYACVRLLCPINVKTAEPIGFKYCIMYSHKPRVGFELSKWNNFDPRKILTFVILENVLI